MRRHMIDVTDIELRIRGVPVEVTGWQFTVPSSYPFEAEWGLLELTASVKRPKQRQVHPGPYRRVGEHRSCEDLNG